MAHFICKFRLFLAGRKLARIRISLKDHRTLRGMKVDFTEPGQSATGRHTVRAKIESPGLTRLPPSRLMQPKSEFWPAYSSPLVVETMAIPAVCPSNIAPPMIRIAHLLVAAVAASVRSIASLSAAMTPETGSALLRVKVRMIAENSENAQHLIPYTEDSLKESPVTLERLREMDQLIETELRFNMPKEKQAQIRKTLDAQFGGSSIADLWEVVAKRVLDRGAVLNDEEHEIIKPMADVFIHYAIELFGEADSLRLTVLWSKYLGRYPCAR
jgi:hypothetical protein